MDLEQPQWRDIVSANNSQMKLIRSLSRRKARRAERVFLLEGRRLIEDALDAGMDVRKLFIRDNVDSACARRLQRPGIEMFRVAAGVFDHSSNVEQSQGFAAICAMPEPADSRLLDGSDLLILDQLRDPGNMGTALRSAAAAGITSALVMPSSVDAYAPKVVRAGMGAHFRLGIGEFDAGWERTLHASGTRLVLAEMDGEHEYDSFDWSVPFVLVLGGETLGLSVELSDLVSTSVCIPMAGQVESLNAAVAGSILMFEAARQRRAIAPRG